MTGILQFRSTLSNLLGQMFGGERKLYAVFGYTPIGGITYREAVGRYRRQDLAARIVEAPANALWANPPIITTSNETWNVIWRDLDIKHRLWKTISRADKMAGMGEFSILIVGLQGGGNLDTVARRVEGRQVIYLQPYASASTDVETLNIDPNSAEFNLPAKYKVQPGLDNLRTITSNVQNAPTFMIDASRVVHIGENFLTDEVFGNPRIERVWNLLDDLLKIAGGTAETYWLTANRGLQIDVDKDMELTPEDADDLSDEIEEYQHQLRRFIRTRGVKVNVLGTDVPNPKEVFSMILSMISGATGIPKRILIGSEAGQLASAQDRNNWAERIEERRVEFGEPVVIWPLLHLLMDVGVLPRVADADISIVWPDAFQLSPFEVAQASAQRARSAINLAKTLESPAKVITREEARSIIDFEGVPEFTDAEEEKLEEIQGIDETVAPVDSGITESPEDAV